MHKDEATTAQYAKLRDSRPARSRARRMAMVSVAYWTMPF